jgi:3-hydroxyacyl-CoA dehydrogenase
VLLSPDCAGLFCAQTTYDGFDTLDLVVEAVIENVKLKQDIFATLEKVCNKSCILATNTRYAANSCRPA